jgi:hypothetical protein
MVATSDSRSAAVDGSGQGRLPPEPRHGAEQAWDDQPRAAPHPRTAWLPSGPGRSAERGKNPTAKPGKLAIDAVLRAHVEQLLAHWLSRHRLGRPDW